MTDKDAQTIVAKILDEDRFVISYRPSWKEITGSVNATILLQQVRFHWHKMGGPFYKFFSPPKKKHKAYRLGDSWTEELGFTLRELQGAIKKIGKQLKHSEMENIKEALDGVFFGYYRDREHQTWHYFNESYFLEQIVKIYHKSPNDKLSFGKVPDNNLSSSQMTNCHLAKQQNVISILTETLTETPTEIQEAKASKPSLSKKEKPDVTNCHPGDESPKPKKPDLKMELKETFVKETGSPWVFSGKKDEGYAWSQINLILKLASGDIDRAKKLVKLATQELRQNNLLIPGPQSLVKTIKGIIGKEQAAARKNSTNGNINMTAYQKRLEEEAKEKGL